MSSASSLFCAVGWWEGRGVRCKRAFLGGVWGWHNQDRMELSLQVNINFDFLSKHCTFFYVICNCNMYNAIFNLLFNKSMDPIGNKLYLRAWRVIHMHIPFLEFNVFCNLSCFLLYLLFFFKFKILYVFFLNVMICMNKFKSNQIVTTGILLRFMLQNDFNMIA